MSWRRRLMAWAVSWLVKVWISTLRFKRVGPEIVGPSLVAFWHGDQLPLLGERPSGLVVAPMSLSRDGRLQARIMGRFGIQDVPGSSSRGGLGAVRGLLRALRADAVALMAVDGPRGPRHEIKPGIIYLAQRMRVPVYPVGVAARRFKRLSAWDRFLLPLPFTRVVVCVGEPMAAIDGHRLTETMHALEAQAQAHVNRGRS